MDISTVLDLNNTNLGTGAASGRSDHEEDDLLHHDATPDVEVEHHVVVQLQKQSSTCLAVDDD